VPQQLSLEELGAIEVTSVSKQPMDLWGSAVAVSVITREDIRRSGSTSLPELLRLAPGVEVARVDGSHWSIGIRGFGEPVSKSLLVLLDGRNIYTPLFAGTYWPAYDTVIEDIERIEVIRGPGGTIWGGNAVNGVINIITRRSADTLGTLASIGIGSTDRAVATMRYGGSSGTNLHYRVSAKGFKRGPLHHPDGADFDGDWWMAQGGFRLDWDTQARGSLTVQGDASRGQHRIRFQESSYTPVARVVVDELAETSGGYVLANWQHQLAGTRVQVQAYYDRLVWVAPNFSETRDTIDVDFVQNAPPRFRQQFTWGAGLRWSPSTFTPASEMLDFTPRDHTDRLYSAFLQDELQIVSGRLSLTAGGKLEHNVYTGVELMPNARVAWTPSINHTAWIAASRAVRTPSRIERAISLTALSPLSGPTYLEYTGSSTFETERAVSYEAGYRVRAGSQVSVDLTTYFTRHDDIAGFALGEITIERTPTLHRLARVRYVNALLGTSHGFEIAPVWRPVSWWRLTGAYAFRRVDLRANPINFDPNAVAFYEGLGPHHLGHVESRLTLPRGWEIDATYRQVGALTLRQVDGYRAADVRIGWRWAESVAVSVSGRNLFDRHHLEYNHEPGPPVQVPRSVFAAVTWTHTGEQ
jgi:iron complex outermembrane receptor protein